MLSRHSSNQCKKKQNNDSVQSHHAEQKSRAAVDGDHLFEPVTISRKH
jgi:hypothetical protein